MPPIPESSEACQTEKKGRWKEVQYKKTRQVELQLLFTLWKWIWRLKKTDIERYFYIRQTKSSSHTLDTYRVLYLLCLHENHNFKIPASVFSMCSSGLNNADIRRLCMCVCVFVWYCKAYFYWLFKEHIKVV